MRKRRVKKTQPKCPTCVYLKYDETWGEYKCTLNKRRIYNMEEYSECKLYKKGAEE